MYLNPATLHRRYSMEQPYQVFSKKFREISVQMAGEKGVAVCPQTLGPVVAYQILEAEYNFEARAIRRIVDYWYFEIMHPNLKAATDFALVGALLFHAIKTYRPKADDGSLVASVASLLVGPVDTEAGPPTQMGSKTGSGEALQELEAMVGLQNVKEQVTTLSNVLMINKERREKGLRTTSSPLHCVFLGNPGTGKTTVARILAKLFKDMGLLSKGHLVEVDRSTLVGQYIGHTAKHTTAAIDEAMGGVLFIDEAYSLHRSDEGKDFGIEAIETLLKRMEDDRDKFSVIVAGYKDQMVDFMASNPGLQSRFNRQILFEDYSPDEMLQIFLDMAEERDYKVGRKARGRLKALFVDHFHNPTATFANGRTVRNIFNQAVENQANRVVALETRDEDDYLFINTEDIPKVKVKEEDTPASEIVPYRTKPAFRTGVITYYNVSKGFGFLDSGGESFFFHINQVEEAIRDSGKFGGVEVTFLEVMKPGINPEKPAGVAAKVVLR